MAPPIQWNNVTADFSGANQSMANASHSMNNVGTIANNYFNSLRQAQQDKIAKERLALEDARYEKDKITEDSRYADTMSLQNSIDKRAERSLILQEEEAAIQVGKDRATQLEKEETSIAMADPNEYLTKFKELIAKNNAYNIQLDGYDINNPDPVISKVEQEKFDKAKPPEGYSISLLNKMRKADISKVQEFIQKQQENKSNDEFRKNTLALDKDKVAFDKENILYNRALYGGELHGMGINPDETKTIPATPNIYKEDVDAYVNKYFPKPDLSTKVLDNAYKEYLGDDYNKLEGGLSDIMINRPFFPAVMGSAVLGLGKLIVGESQKHKDAQKNVPKVPVKLSKAEFIKQYTEKKTKEQDNKRKTFLEQLKTDKNLQKKTNLLKVDPKATTTVVKSRAELQKEAEAYVEAYRITNHLSNNSPEILGIKKSIIANINETIANRREDQLIVLKSGLENKKLDEAQRKKLEAILYKVSLSRELTPAEELQLVKTKTEIDLNKQELYDKQDSGFF